MKSIRFISTAVGMAVIAFAMICLSDIIMPV
jgi:hypothetical protein